MEVYSIDITSWTASFRYRNLISGMQPTLEVPPISTVLGLINAAAGRYLTHEGLLLGYYFEYGAKAVDLETVYMIDSNSKGRPTNFAKTNVIRREFLFETFLRIYVNDERIAEYLAQPYFPLVLGRKNDLASVDIKSIGMRTLQPVSNAEKIKGQVIEFESNQLPGMIQALARYFTPTFPREPVGVAPFSIINWQANIQSGLTSYRDQLPNGSEVDIVFHKIDTGAWL